MLTVLHPRGTDCQFVSHMTNLINFSYKRISGKKTLNMITLRIHSYFHGTGVM